jgi:hypothetical protein
MARIMNSIAMGGIVCSALVLPLTARAQVDAPLEPDTAAVAATIAAIQYLFVEVDSIEAVSWPSAKSLLARRPGIVALSGISTRFGEDPARAIALTEHVVAALDSRGIPSRTVPRSDAQYCGTGDSRHCSLPDDVGLLLLIGYPSASDTSQVARITMVTDSRVRSGRPVVSLDVVVHRANGNWTVASVGRTRFLSDQPALRP